MGHILSPYGCNMQKSTDIIHVKQISIIYAISVDIFHAKSLGEAFMPLCPSLGYAAVDTSVVDAFSIN